LLARLLGPALRLLLSVASVGLMRQALRLSHGAGKKFVLATLQDYIEEDDRGRDRQSDGSTKNKHL
jgi:hypothetical protein